MSAEKILETGANVIKNEGEAVLELLNKLDSHFIEAIDKIYSITGRVVITGVGKSGLIARKIVATFNSTGTPAIYLHPTDAVHGDLGMVRKEDVVILISKSGETQELITMIPMLKRIGVYIIGMLGRENSKIGSQSDIVLNVSVKEEACPYDLAPTSSTTAALVMGDALAISLLELRGFTEEDFAFLHPGGSLGKRLSLKISEIMYTGEEIPAVSEDTPLKDTIIEMASKRLGTTGVVNSEKKLTGIITDGDLRRLLEKTLDIKHLTAKDVMTSGPKTIRKEFLASFALQEMERYKITTLLVTDESGKIEGIVHLHDLVKLGLQRR